jgi:hypothetical protein
MILTAPHQPYDIDIDRTLLLSQTRNLKNQKKKRVPITLFVSEGIAFFFFFFPCPSSHPCAAQTRPAQQLRHPLHPPTHAK